MPMRRRSSAARRRRTPGLRARSPPATSPTSRRSRPWWRLPTCPNVCGRTSGTCSATPRQPPGCGCTARRPRTSRKPLRTAPTAAGSWLRPLTRSRACARPRHPWSRRWRRTTVSGPIIERIRELTKALPVPEPVDACPGSAATATPPGEPSEPEDPQLALLDGVYFMHVTAKAAAGCGRDRPAGHPREHRPDHLDPRLGHLAEPPGGQPLRGQPRRRPGPTRSRVTCSPSTGPTGRGRAPGSASPGTARIHFSHVRGLHRPGTRRGLVPAEPLGAHREPPDLTSRILPTRSSSLPPIRHGPGVPSVRG